jgi:hypothetical protein
VTRVLCLALAVVLAATMLACGSGEPTTSGSVVPTSPGDVLPTATQPRTDTPAPTNTPIPTDTPEPTATPTRPPLRTAAPGETAPDLTGLKPCKLLTAEEIGAAIGKTANEVGGGIQLNQPPAYNCTWNGVRIEVFTGTLEDVQLHHAYSNETVGDLGENASWFAAHKQLSVLSGFFDVTVYVTGDESAAAAKSAAIHLVTKALANLP